MIAKTIHAEPCLGRPFQGGHLWWMPEARAAMRAVAQWLRSNGYPIAASLLEQEANR
ncbi:MAG: hypothetical protein ACK559_17180 [bacterium]